MTFKSPFHLSSALAERKEKGLFRSLISEYPGIDFSSNDYLGFSRSGLLRGHDSAKSLSTGSAGSRLISGNSKLFEETEGSIAAFHGAEAALLFNSGYDANVGLLSSVPQKGDLVLFDELIHASIYDGIRLSYARSYKFRHNNLQHLEELLQRQRELYTEVYIVVESVYSMDGDCAPLAEIVALCRRYNALLIVDEAHAIGVFGAEGRGLCQELGVEDCCFARVYTYGKAMGCHGAAVVGELILRDYLINFARSFIYTTAMPGHSLQHIREAYALLPQTDRMAALHETINYFNTRIAGNTAFIPSISSIHCCIIPGNDQVQQLEAQLRAKNIFAKAIKSPTVKAGQERIRICLHAYNTAAETELLLDVLQTVKFQ